jgi:hypothetical protein
VTELAGFPFASLQFTREGVIHDQTEMDALLSLLEREHVTDLFAVSHGWNNDMVDARALYAALFQSVHARLDAGHFEALAARRFAVLGIFWPSKKFADSELIPSGAASVGSVVSEEILRRQIDSLRGVFSAPGADVKLLKARDLIGQLDDSPAAREEFVDLIRSILPRGAANDEDASDRFFQVEGDQLMRRLSQPILPAPRRRRGSGGASSVGGGPRGGAAGFELSLSGMKAAARRLLNYATYYQMKERAGTVGEAGVNQALRAVRESHPGVHIHLAGHSFGGRLVTAAIAGRANFPPVRVSTLTLLQAAYSHNGLAQRYDGRHDGVFRRVVADGLVSGPTMITCTSNDIAVGQAYPIASRIANQAASALGDKDDLYGGMGRNGAQHTPEAVAADLLRVPSTYRLEARKIYNLHGDAFISHHGDVTGPEVAQAILAAVAVT